jgi:hypothetical protein
MNAPVFVKGNIRFELNGQRYEFLQQLVSTGGVNGLPWGALSPTENFGAQLDVELEIVSDEPLSLEVRAHLTREYTTTTETMGVHFDLDPEQERTLGAYVARYGETPKDIPRKYPRIPSNTLIQTFPTHALVSANSSAALALTNDQSLVFDVVNLSPQGALLSTENQMALMMQPGEKVTIVLQPRGWFPTQIRLQATIQRVTDDVAGISGNLIRFMGVKFGKIDELSRTAFLDLLKDILEQLKETGTR